MAFGILHVVYAINAAAMMVCFTLVAKKYLSERIGSR